MAKAQGTYIEKRKYPRLNKSIPVRIVLQDPRTKSDLSYEAIGRNISRGGMSIEPSSQEILSLNLQPGKNLLNLEINLAEENVHIKAVADVVWTKKLEALDSRLTLGTRFREITETNRLDAYLSELLQEEELSISQVIKKRLPLKPDADGLPKVTLLIDGEDVDTGKYEYFPYADKSITEPKETFKISMSLKRNELPGNYKDYIFAKYCVNQEESNQKAILSAQKAFEEFRHFSINLRKKILEDIYSLLIANKEMLIELLIIEGHSRKLAEWEFLGMKSIVAKENIEFYKNELWKLVYEDEKERAFLSRRPDGVVCINPPRNAPCSNSFAGTLVLLTGNSVVIKPPFRTPLSTTYLWRKIVYEALRQNGAPKGIVNIVIGNSKKIMDEWIESTYVKDIIYYGESEKGLEVASRAFQFGKKVILELSGSDMLLVWKDADIERAIDSLLDGFLGSTQICMVPKKALIHEEIYDTFVNKFMNEVKKLTIGLPTDSDVVLTPVMKINDFFTFLNDALEKDARLLCGGERLNYKGEVDSQGTFIKPALLYVEDSNIKDMLCIQEENFFPLIPLVKITSNIGAKDNIKSSNKDEIISDKMITITNSNKYGLRISIWVNSNFYIEKFSNELQNSGLLRVNSKHIAFSPCLAPHGGVGKTGGPYGDLNYDWLKTSHLQGISIYKNNQTKRKTESK